MTDPQVQSSHVSALLLFNLTLVSLFAFVIYLATDNVIFITRDGINMPFFVCPGPWVRVRKKWNELLSVQFIEKNSKNGSLILHLKGGNTVRLNLALIAPQQLDQLIMALDVWSEGSENFTALLDARAHINLLPTQKSTAQDGQLRYTELWQEELGRRFGATNFIPLEPGDLVYDSQYTVERQLAFGGLSAIYLARRKDQNKVVLKEAVVPQNEKAELIEQSHHMLDREAKMLAALSHQQIARVFDHFVDQGRHYLVIEYIPGQDLRQLVQEEGAQKEKQVLVWAEAMAAMLIYLHEQAEPIIHRDFTPDNLLLKTDGSIVVIDFGAANFFLGTATGTMIGKQSYIAPEQLRGKATCQSDIYAFGCCLFYLSTGEDPEPLSASHPQQKVPSLSNDFDLLVAHCTQMEKEDRPSDAKAVLKAVQKVRGIANVG